MVERADDSTGQEDRGREEHRGGRRAGAGAARLRADVVEAAVLVLAQGDGNTPIEVITPSSQIIIASPDTETESNQASSVVPHSRRPCR